MRFRPFILLLGLFAPVAPAMGEVRAVLVGVGDYLYLDADLKGPGADVALMAEVLVKRGVVPGNITALTTDPALLMAGIPHAPPSRDAILQAIALAGDASETGDTVLFYFSGHGSQAPDRNGDEPGGYDEILLPMDARGWKGAVSEVENALGDDVLQDWARGLLNRGVRVVGVIDACHSGTGFRAAPGAGLARVIAPEALGIPDDVPEVAPVDTPPLTGDFVFLYSSQANQRSFEYPLDPSDPEGRWQGSFTLALVRALHDGDGASWAQVLAAARTTMQRGSVRQDPDGEGPLLDQQVFGRGRPTDRTPVRDGQLLAGLLGGFSTGDEVAFYGGPSGDEVLGHARVAEISATAAHLDPPPPPGARWAEVTMPAPLPPLRLAPAVRADADDGHDYHAWEEALALAVADGLAQGVARAAAAVDLVPVLVDGTIALAGADGQLDPDGPGSSPRIVRRDGEDIAEVTARAVERAAYALRFRGTLAALAGRRAKSAMAMTVEHGQGTVAADGSCGKPGTPALLSGQDVAPCDALWLTLTNGSATPQDVTVFYQSGDFALDPLWPSRGLSNRLLPGESTRVGLMIAPRTPPNAVEEILVVAVEASDSGARADLARLATPDRLRGSPAGVRPATDSIEALLDADRVPRGFTARRPPLSFLRQTVRIVASGTLPR